MEITTEIVHIKTRGNCDIIDITDRVQDSIDSGAFGEGSVTVFAVGSTAGITTVEYEPGLVEKDLPRLFESLAPYGQHYAHHETWGDDNGSSHVRASLVGSSVVVPFVDGELLLGTWQQIVCMDFDTRPRKRKIVIQISGMKKSPGSPADSVVRIP